MDELWKPVPGHDGYEASNCGRIRSVDRTIMRKHADGKVICQPLKGVVLRPVECKNGYLYVSIRGRSYQVHRLVAKVWVAGFMPGLDASHNDGNKLNNCATNLSWKTRKANLADQIRHNTRLRGERQNGAVLTSEDVTELRSLRAQGWSWRELGMLFGVASTTAKNACTGRTWAHLALDTA